MKVSTKGRYALRLMLDLAVHGNGEHIPIKKIAERQEVSGKYLEQIITILSRAGFVRSVRGAAGGYILAYEPSYYTVGMVLRLTEGDLAPVACLQTPENYCERSEQCPTLMVWDKLANAINDVVDSITLADLLENYNNISKNSYQI